MNNKFSDIPLYINMSAMAEFLQLSRSRLYQLIDQGVLLKPVYLISNKRPIYTREMALCNLQVKQNNVGINGEIIMFYSARIQATSNKSKKPAEKSSLSSNKHHELIEALESLGLENITASQIDSAILKCFPDGTENVSEDEILREVFRHLKCRDPEHKQRA